MPLSRSLRHRIIVGLVATATTLAITAVAQPASAAPAPKPLPGSQPKWLGNARDEGTTASASKVDFGILLDMRNQSGAVAALRKVSDPTSASYGQWLTNAQFKASYSPTAADTSAVQNWLGSQGFNVTKSLQSGMYVEASGSAAQVEKTFGAAVHNFSYQGKIVRANTSQLSLPAGTPTAVAAAVGGVLGIDQGAALKNPAATLPGPPTGSRSGVQPCSAYTGQKIATDKPAAYDTHQPYTVCGYVPSQLQSAYGERALLDAGVDGTGVTVAITDAFASPTILNDANTYSTRHGQAPFKKGQFTQITPAADGYDLIDKCGGSGWYGEETLDVEAVHAMAPGAKIVYVGGADCGAGLDEAWAETIDNHVADVITNSWGTGTDDVNLLGQGYVDFYTQFSLEAALTGITVNFPSGDAGDNTTGGTDLASKTVDFPADLPYVTGVGGTTLQIGADGQRIGEYGWQNAYSGLTDGAWTPNPPGVYSSGGGGGTSVLFGQPFYQRGKVPVRLSRAKGRTAMRAVPDIAMDADSNTGMLIGETQTFPNGTYYDEYRLGGTSLASPLLAGVIAVADQLNGQSYGFINPLYYQLIGTQAVYDEAAPKQPLAEVRTGYANRVDASAGLKTQLRTIDVQTSTLHDRPGYDNETGVGSPSGPHFFFGLLLAQDFPKG